MATLPSSVESHIASFHSLEAGVDGITSQMRILLTSVRAISYGALSRPSEDELQKLRCFDDILYEASFTIRTYLNRSPPINRVPLEILSFIFALSSTEALPSGILGCEDIYFVSVQKLWPIITICRLWSMIMFSTPTLWSDVIVTKEDRATSHSYLRLARDIPLRLYIKPLGASLAMPLLEQHGPRFQEIYFPDRFCYWPTDEEDSSHKFFASIARKLRHLALSPALHIPPDNFPNLTHLTLRAQVPSLELILSLLSRTPRLQVLYASVSATGRSAVPSNVPKDAVVLPFLDEIMLRLDGIDAASVLSRLSLPRVRRFRTDCVGFGNLAPLVHHLSSQASSALVEPLTRLRILPDKDCHSCDDNAVALYTVELTGASGSCSVILGVKEFECGRNTSEQRRALAEPLAGVLAAPLFADVDELWVHGWTELVSPSLAAALPNLSTLGVVLAQGSWTTEIPDALVLGDDVAAGRPLWPGLTLMCVHSCGGREIDRLEQVVVHRSSAGYPISRLFVECQGEALHLAAHTKELAVGPCSERGWWEDRASPAECRVHDGEWPKWPRWDEWLSERSNITLGDRVVNGSPPYRIIYRRI